MKHTLFVICLSMITTVVWAQKLGFTTSDIQEHPVKPAGMNDKNLEAQLDAPDDPIPAPKMLPIEENTPPPAIHADRTVQRPQPGVTRILPPKQMVSKSKFVRTGKRKTLVATNKKKKMKHKRGYAYHKKIHRKVASTKSMRNAFF